MFNFLNLFKIKKAEGSHLDVLEKIPTLERQRWNERPNHLSKEDYHFDYEQGYGFLESNSSFRRRIQNKNILKKENKNA